LICVDYNSSQTGNIQSLNIGSFIEERETMKNRHKQFQPRPLHYVTLLMILLFRLAKFTFAFLPIQNHNIMKMQHLRTIEDSKMFGATNNDSKEYSHGLAILRMPSTSIDRIANEAILETAVLQTKKLSVILRSSESVISLALLRRYVGEVYSTLWDCAFRSDASEFLNVVVYPQNLPNTAPEQWIHLREDLDMVCSHDSICGWFSDSASGRGTMFSATEGLGGLKDHVAALNTERQNRGLLPVEALQVDPWPKGSNENFLKENNVMFMDDEGLEAWPMTARNTNSNLSTNEDERKTFSFLGGARIDSKSLFNKVCVGGTFDGMHYGHRKLLTLAVSSVLPQTGTLLIGVTVDEMLKGKKYADLIPPLHQRMDNVREFLYRLAPGMKNRIKIMSIRNSFGPPGSPTKEGENFDALVLSHETIENGHLLNLHRVNKLGFKPLTLLCTRRTEVHGMSSTKLRERRSRLLEEKVRKFHE